VKGFGTELGASQACSRTNIVHVLVLRATYGCPRVALGAAPNKPFGATWSCPGLALDVALYFLPFETYLNVIPGTTLRGCFGTLLRVFLRNMGMPSTCLQSGFKRT